ncbi:MAG: EAL domain-containing protein [bacterium]
MRNKIMFFLIIISSTIFLAGYIGAKNSKELVNDIDLTYKNGMYSLQLLNSCHDYIKDIDFCTRQMLLSDSLPGKSEKEYLKFRVGYEIDLVNTLLSLYSRYDLDVQQKIWLKNVKNDFANYIKRREQILKQDNINQQVYFADVNYYLDSMNIIFKNMSDHSLSLLAGNNQDKVHMLNACLNKIYLFSIFTAFVVLILGLIGSAYFTRPITAMIKEFKKISDGNIGDLCNSLPVLSGDELGKLTEGFNRMAGDLQRSFAEIDEKIKQIDHSVYHDYLTELLNRGGFYKKMRTLLEECQEKGQKIYLFYLDMDGFKDINDTLGHYIGDKFLVSLSRKLIYSLERYELIARLGGDEFAVVYVDLSGKEEARQIAEKILSLLADPFFIEGKTIHGSGSLGISVFPDDALKTEDLTVAGDMAMFQAKSLGRSHYCFYDSSMGEHIQKKNILDMHLRKAVENEELLLYLQPKINAFTLVLEGFEALLRWKNKELGLISPGDFIPIAEENGMIIALGDWALRETCRIIQAWHKQGLPKLKIAVNVSPVQIKQDDFVKRALEIIDLYKVEPKYIEFEITESVFIDDSKKAMEVLNRLRRIGFSIALDDFGTGFSSLEYIKSFPLDTVKIDKIFIDSICSSEKQANLTKAIIYMVHNLGMHVVAEGVESSDQLKLLQDYGCNQIQGYFFSPPLSKEEAEGFIIKNHRYQE